MKNDEKEKKKQWKIMNTRETTMKNDQKERTKTMKKHVHHF